VDPAQNAKLQMLHQCWAVGQWERMEMLGRELLVPAPSDADLLNAVGVAVFQLDRRDEARRFFEEAMVNEPDHAPSHSMMGWYWARKKKFKLAEECVRRALAINPSDDDYWVQLGRIMYIQHNYRAAKTCAAKALALEAGNVSAVALDAEADAIADGVGTATPQERRARVESALSLEPENADLHESLGEALEDEGRLREAEERYRESLALDPSRPWLWRKVRRMGLMRDRVDSLLSSPWRLGLWLINEGEFITVFLGLISCVIWAVVCAPIAFLYRLMFRVELEFLAARGTREVSISFGRRILRFVLLGISASVYWLFVWWLTRQDGAWGAAGWGVKVLLFGLVGAGLFFMIRETISESRHRKTLAELSVGEGEGEE
jgi:tetratricopeptide (TPR) repeat protein